jgi:hypothetical protein
LTPPCHSSRVPQVALFYLGLLVLSQGCRVPQVALFYLGLLVFSQGCTPLTREVFSGSTHGAGRKGGERRKQLAGGQLIQGAEAAAKLGSAQTALAVEPPQKLFGGAVRL